MERDLAVAEALREPLDLLLVARGIDRKRRRPQTPQSAVARHLVVGLLLAEQLAPRVQRRVEGRLVDGAQRDVDAVRARELVQLADHHQEDLAGVVVAAQHVRGSQARAKDWKRDERQRATES